ncbi:MAG: hypothetical protein ABSF13_08225 [Smithella sp.]|jgi:hypothetical protein
MKKKPWKSPKIITLERQRAEEAVLASCKGGSTKTTQYSTQSACAKISCAICSAIAAS